MEHMRLCENVASEDKTRQKVATKSSGTILNMLQHGPKGVSSMDGTNKKRSLQVVYRYAAPHFLVPFGYEQLFNDGLSSTVVFTQSLNNVEIRGGERSL